ncbi:MAG: hypothetical protein IJC98_04240, partial [Clostridia bacterium]|nr:hypothetical protein [Clostridia bacterium]
IPALGIAILDGTAPHTVDAVYPGAVETILNMGDFFETSILQQSLDGIREQKQKNAVAHKHAGDFLEAAASVRRTALGLVGPLIDHEKAERLAERIVGRCQKEKTPDCSVRFVSAIGVQGSVHLQTAEKRAEMCVYVSDKRHLSAFFFDHLIAAANAHGVSYTRYAVPLRPEETEGVFFPSLNTVYFSDRYGKCREDASLLNTDRFLDKASFAGIRQRYRFSQKCFLALMDGAYASLAEAGRAHDLLESYYVSAMNFRALDAYTARFVQSLFS